MMHIGVDSMCAVPFFPDATTWSTCLLSLGSHCGDDAWSQALRLSHSCGSCCWLLARTHRPTLYTSQLHASLHTSPWQRDPNKKAVVEKAVDSLKEKKSKSMDVEQEAMVL